MPTPIDEELAVIYRWTVNARWGVSEFMEDGRKDPDSCL